MGNSTLGCLCFLCITGCSSEYRLLTSWIQNLDPCLILCYKAVTVHTKLLGNVFAAEQKYSLSRLQMPTCGCPSTDFDRVTQIFIPYYTNTFPTSMLVGIILIFSTHKSENHSSQHLHSPWSSAYIDTDAALQLPNSVKPGNLFYVSISVSTILKTNFSNQQFGCT